jgi:hypothetical protein
MGTRYFAAEIGSQLNTDSILWRRPGQAPGENQCPMPLGYLYRPGGFLSRQTMMPITTRLIKVTPNSNRFTSIAFFSGRDFRQPGPQSLLRCAS